MKSESLQRKPPWLKIRLPSGPNFEKMRLLVRKGNLHTVCQEAKCPNIWECYSQKTATFMILGDRCSRNCGFCAVEQGPRGFPDPEEPARVADAVVEMELKYVVVTSVTRDDIPDGGAEMFARTIKEIRAKDPSVKIEVLTPDFLGNTEAIEKVARARPDVFNHNIETVPRLYPGVRPEADFSRSVALLKLVKRSDPSILTKSGIMLGLGEKKDEVIQAFQELLDVRCDMLTIGQYLQPTKNHLRVVEFVHPEVFEQLRAMALAMGFSQVASGPFVRSSYHARELFRVMP